jgi:hypothetical protein
MRNRASVDEECVLGQVVDGVTFSQLNISH